jgi:hypothetical protein
MKILPPNPINFIMGFCPKAAFYIAFAMFVGGPRVRADFYEMTSELLHVSSHAEFQQWVIHSQIKLINVTKVDWKPIVMFPEEAKRFK